MYASTYIHVCICLCICIYIYIYVHTCTRTVCFFPLSLFPPPPSLHFHTPPHRAHGDHALRYVRHENFALQHNYSTLQHSATCCNTCMRSAATHSKVQYETSALLHNYSTLQIDATTAHCKTMRHSAAHSYVRLSPIRKCDVRPSQCYTIAAQCNTPQHAGIHSCVRLSSIHKYDMRPPRCNTIVAQCNTLQHAATRCNTLQRIHACGCRPFICAA